MAPASGKRWFGPRIGGWGWCPISWEGWTFTLGWFAVSAGGVLALIGGGHPGWIVGWALLMVGILALTLVVKGYPNDGGPEARDPSDDAR